jgi:hypothetical protein
MGLSIISVVALVFVTSFLFALLLALRFSNEGEIRID